MVFRGRSCTVDELRRQVSAEVAAGAESDLAALYGDLCYAVGDAMASRIWLESFSAYDAAET